MTTNSNNNENIDDDETPTPTSSDIDPTTSDTNSGTLLAEQLNVLLHRLGSEPAAVVMGVFTNWRQLVGETVAEHVSPVKLEAGRLLVEVDEPAWATQIRFLESEIIGKLSLSTGSTINGIDVRVKRNPRTS